MAPLLLRLRTTLEGGEAAVVDPDGNLLRIGQVIAKQAASLVPWSTSPE